MPPDPILALLAFLAIWLWVIVGSIVGVLTTLMLGGRDADYLQVLLDKKERYDNSGNKLSRWGPLAAYICFWPLIAAFAVVMGAVYVIGVGPVFLARKIAAYCASVVAIEK